MLLCKKLSNLLQKYFIFKNNREKYFHIANVSNKCSFLQNQSKRKSAAKVGLAESTLLVTKYSHPKSKNIIFWDLPGIGTPTYPNLKEYCKKVGGLEKYDAFLIFSKTRFTQYNKELAETVSKDLKKPFFFIRTNFDTDLENAKEDEGSEFDKESVLENMKKDCLENLENLIHDENDIYMIDNKVTSKYDFQRLKEAIASALPDGKKESFADSLANVTNAIIRIKANILKGMSLLKAFW